MARLRFGWHEKRECSDEGHEWLRDLGVGVMVAAAFSISLGMPKKGYLDLIQAFSISMIKGYLDLVHPFLISVG